MTAAARQNADVADQGGIMDQKKTDRLAERRAFLKKAGTAAASVPAAALLLSAEAKASDGAPDPSGGIVTDGFPT